MNPLACARRPINETSAAMRLSGTVRLAAFLMPLVLVTSCGRDEPSLSPGESPALPSAAVPQQMLAAAAEAVAACDGPRIPIAGEQGYDMFRRTDWAPGSVFDGVRASWQSQKAPQCRNPYAIVLGSSRQGSSGFCWNGGKVLGMDPAEVTWCENKRSPDTSCPNGGRNGAGLSFAVESGTAVIEGARLHNVHDGINVMHGKDGAFVIKEVWLTHVRDDCIQNDRLAGGVVQDSLFDGCYTFFSAVNPKSGQNRNDNAVLIRNNLVRLEAQTGPFRDCSPNNRGHGRFFKNYKHHSPWLHIHDNIFFVEETPNERPESILGFNPNKLASCSDNIVLWAGTNVFPEPLPPCFEVINRDGREPDRARSMWYKYYDKWSDARPDFGRFPFDG